MSAVKNIFSSVYIEHCEKLEKAKRVYESVPNAYTKRALEVLESKKFTYQERYTPEYIREYQNSKKQAQTNAEDEIKHLLNATHVEDLFASNKITGDRRIELHRINDEKFNLSYLSYGNNY